MATKTKKTSNKPKAKRKISEKQKANLKKGRKALYLKLKKEFE